MILLGSRKDSMEAETDLPKPTIEEVNNSKYILGP